MDGSGNALPTNSWITDLRPRLYADDELEFIAALHEMRMTTVQAAAVKNPANICAATAARAIEGVPTAGGTTHRRAFRCTLGPQCAQVCSLHPETKCAQAYRHTVHTGNCNN